MARRRLRLAYIVNQSKRKASYYKRKRGVVKKLNELTVLCDADAAMIMYSSFEQGPVIWPTGERVQELIARFMQLPDVQQTRRMMSQDSFVAERLEKLGTLLLKLKRENREKEMNALMHKIFSEEQIIDYLSSVDLNDLGWVLNTNIAESVMRIERDSPTPTPFLPAAPSLATASPPVLGSGTSNVVAPADVFSRQSYQGTVGIQTPISANLNPGTPWSYQNWAFMNDSNQNDPTQGRPGPSTQ
ncbi:PREDICTED: agamous-like MADS-box protein AGL80 [Ipomoea nil]|uniref:agamous-like MADS-box protein AGL80 n=1 Tax=Ipomoea nil TaxID=35883 RepID=UPI000901C594|nr:PREDICTED: agamous-like MADS-box protein AGL80 [Ipomoea nil]